MRNVINIFIHIVKKKTISHRVYFQTSTFERVNFINIFVLFFFYLLSKSSLPPLFTRFLWAVGKLSITCMYHLYWFDRELWIIEKNMFSYHAPLVVTLPYKCKHFFLSFLIWYSKIFINKWSPLSACGVCDFFYHSSAVLVLLYHCFIYQSAIIRLFVHQQTKINLSIRYHETICSLTDSLLLKTTTSTSNCLFVSCLVQKNSKYGRPQFFFLSLCWKEGETRLRRAL